MNRFAHILACKGYNSPEAIATARRWANQYGSGSSDNHGLKVGDTVKHTRTGEVGKITHVSHGGYIAFGGAVHNASSVTKV